MAGTAFSEIIVNYIMQNIDDLRWEEELTRNAALFMRSKSLLLMNAVPRFNKPPEMRQRLAFTPPTYADDAYTVQGGDEAPLTIQTGQVGFEICTAGVVALDQLGNPIYTPLTDISYDAETGEITINTGSFAAGNTIDIDFYTDGGFETELNETEKRILGLCGAYAWYNRFGNTWLNAQPKIKDPNFKTEAESGWIRATSEKQRLLRVALDGEMRAYENALVYDKIVPDFRRIKSF